MSGMAWVAVAVWVLVAAQAVAVVAVAGWLIRASSEPDDSGDRAAVLDAAESSDRAVGVKRRYEPADVYDDLDDDDEGGGSGHTYDLGGDPGEPEHVELDRGGAHRAAEDADRLWLNPDWRTILAPRGAPEAGRG